VPRRRPIVQIIVIAASLIATTIVVSVSGGTESFAINFFYLIIVYAGYALGEVGGIIVSLLAAFCCGPYLAPEDKLNDQPLLVLEETLLRTTFFWLAGVVSARVASELRRSSAEFQTLYEVARTITSSLRLNQVLQTIAESATQVMSGRACAIRLLSPDGERLELAAECGLSEEYRSKGDVTLTDSDLDRRVLAGAVVSILDVTTDPRFQYREEAKAEGLSSVLSAPLRSKDRAIGVIRIYSQRRRAFLAREEALLSAFASQAAVAIENAELYEDLHRSYFETVRALTRAIEARDPATYGHSERVMQLSLKLARKLRLSQEECENIEFGAILHDIGKIGLDERALATDFPSEPDEELWYRMHPMIGKTILAAATFLEPAIPIVLYHHERWDGQGFPEGLAREATPLYARLVAVTNEYDHLVSPLGDHAAALSAEQALHEITSGAGTKFDPKIVAAFRSLF